MKKLTHCLGDGNDLFVIIEERDTAVWLRKVGGNDHGWKSKHKLIPVAEEYVQNLLDYHERMVAELRTHCR